VGGPQQREGPAVQRSFPPTIPSLSIWQLRVLNPYALAVCFRSFNWIVMKRWLLHATDQHVSSRSFPMHSPYTPWYAQRQPVQTREQQLPHSARAHNPHSHKPKKEETFTPKWSPPPPTHQDSLNMVFSWDSLFMKWITPPNSPPIAPWRLARRRNPPHVFVK
jgi:hypothetical protein